MRNWNSTEKHVCAVFLSDLVMFIKTVCDMIACNSYLVKSVNLAFTHVLFRSVYSDDAASNVKVNMPKLLAPSLTTDETNPIRVILSWTGLIQSGEKTAARKNDPLRILIRCEIVNVVSMSCCVQLRRCSARCLRRSSFSRRATRSTCSARRRRHRHRHSRGARTAAN